MHSLRFYGPTSSLNLILVDGKKSRTPYLDDGGFACVAFIVKELDETLKRIMDFGGHHQLEPFHVVINNRPLRVTMLRGPSNELIELIEPESGHV